MKTKRLIALAMSVSALAALALTSGCVIEGPPPPGGPAVVSIYPDDYVWDGFEYVGVIGSQYYYLGPGNAWIVCDPVRVHRFNVWVGAHPDWRAHATVNLHDRGYAQGHKAPRGHGYGHGHGHDHDYY